MYHRLKYIVGFYYSTRRAVFYSVEVCMTGSRSLKMHKERTWRPSTSTTKVKVQIAREMILVSRWEIISKVVLYKLVMVPHTKSFTTSFASVKSWQLKSGCLSTVTQLLQQRWRRRYFSKNNHRKWHMCPWIWSEIQRQSMEQKHPESPVKKRLKTQFCANNVIVTVFCSSKQPTLEHYPQLPK